MNLTDHEAMKALITRQMNDANRAVSDLGNQIAEREVSAWESKGGCKKCLGTERVLTWSTLDSEGYDEFGPCQDCTDATRAAGKHPLCYAPRGSRSSGVTSSVEYAKSNFYKEMEEVLVAAGIANENFRTCISNELHRGDYIIVVKGRKVPVGNHGMVIAIVGGSYGPRVGFIDGTGTVVWIAAANVERCLGMDGETKRPAIEAFIKNDNDYRKSKRLPLKNHDVVAMMMQMV